MKQYLTNVGWALDRLLNALTGGSYREEVSLRAALAEREGKKWGCYLCKWLHHTVESRHCEKTLDPVAVTKNAAAIKALIQLALFFILLHYLTAEILYR